MERVVLCVVGAEVLQQMNVLLVKTVMQALVTQARILIIVQVHVPAITDISLILMLISVPFAILPAITAQEAEPVTAIYVNSL